jgi:hypothetical protein
MLEVINIIGLGVTDPHIRIHGERAYLYASRDHAIHNDTFVMREWQVWSSGDLLNWKLESKLRPEETYIGRPIDGCWATDAIEKDGRYYWCFSEVDKSGNRHQIGLVSSDHPGGPWKDTLGQPLLADGVADTEVYDPCLFKDDDGSVYIFFGVWDYFFARMRDDMRGVADKPQRIEIINPAGPYGAGKTDDKVFVHKRNGIYYLSWGSYYATSDRLAGPYTYRGCFVDPARIEQRFRERTWPHGPTQGRHGSFFEWNGQWFFAYCEMSFSGNRYYRDFWISYVHYRDNGEIEPIRINSQAVGCYDASAGRIEAENFLKGTGTTVDEIGGGDYSITLKGDGSHVVYPNVRRAGGFQMITLCVAATGSTAHLLVESVREDPHELARINLNSFGVNGYQVHNLQLNEPLGEPENIRIRLEGNPDASVKIDWFQLSE